jgi:hypothetical protein
MSSRRSRGWHKEQRSTIGGNAAAIIANKNEEDLPIGNLQDLARRMNDPTVELEDDGDDERPDLRRGRLLERIARQRLAEELGVKVRAHPQRLFLYNDAMPYAHALPDGWIGGQGPIMKPGEARPVALDGDPAELKVPRPKTWQRLFEYGIFDYYEIQIQHTLGVTMKPVEHWSALHPVTMGVLYQERRRDDGVIEQLMKAEARFIIALREGRPLPEPEDIVLPKRKGLITLLDTPGAREAAEMFREAQALLEAVGETYKRAQVRLADELAEIDAADIPIEEGRRTLRVYNRESQGRRMFDYQAFLADQPHLRPLAEAYFRRGAPSRSLRSYLLKQED